MYTYGHTLSLHDALPISAGEFDCVGVFAPFWLTALERPGSKALFSSADFPGLIPDHIVASRELVDEDPEAVQKLVDAWYLTLQYLEENPEEAMDNRARVAMHNPRVSPTFTTGTTKL